MKSLKITLSRKEGAVNSWLGVALGIFVQGLFSGSEIAVLAADSLALKKAAKKGSRGAALALKLKDSTEMIFSTTLLVTSACMVLITALVHGWLRLQGV